MKKSKAITLVLITAALASCHSRSKEQHKREVYMRSDTTASYSHASRVGMWYYCFRAYGLYQNGMYRRTGFYSGGLSQRANVGSNSTKGSIMRGGFGRGAVSVSS